VQNEIEDWEDLQMLVMSQEPLNKVHKDISMSLIVGICCADTAAGSLCKAVSEALWQWGAQASERQASSAGGLGVFDL